MCVLARRWGRRASLGWAVASQRTLPCTLPLLLLLLPLQEADLRGRPDIVVATPGRMLDHIRNSLAVHCDDVDVLVLDEADRLLEMGFEDEVRGGGGRGSPAISLPRSSATTLPPRRLFLRRSRRSCAPAPLAARRSSSPRR